MTQEASNPKETLSLKLPEPEVSSSEPWGDDVLGRAEIAGRLTNLIRDQSSPFTISIHGYWGTGKTFMLKRWQKDLENQGFQAIYFNAWEDDFCDDPLLAIIGQLAEHFREGSLAEWAKRIGAVVKPLVRQTVDAALPMATGLPVRLPQQRQNLLDPLYRYRVQTETKQRLKTHLAEMSAKVRKDSEHPVVFIIDELDRCRPTFAIELLERVKHIFDVPDLVFVFGINRDELCKSLASVYGDIDVDVYLRRFFDMEFTLPEVDSENFARYLITYFGLEQFFGNLSNRRNPRQSNEPYLAAAGNLPTIWSLLGFTLREIDSCIRLISLLGRNLGPGKLVSLVLLGVLMTLKVKNIQLYRRFTQGNCNGSEVIDYFDNLFPSNAAGRFSVGIAEGIEVEVYAAESRVVRVTPLTQLQSLRDGSVPSQPQLLAKRTYDPNAQPTHDPERIMRLSDLVDSRMYEIGSGEIQNIARMIDLHQEMVRR